MNAQARDLFSFTYPNKIILNIFLINFTTHYSISLILIITRPIFVLLDPYHVLKILFLFHPILFYLNYPSTLFFIKLAPNLN